MVKYQPDSVCDYTSGQYAHAAPLVGWHAIDNKDLKLSKRESATDLAITYIVKLSLSNMPQSTVSVI